MLLQTLRQACQFGFTEFTSRLKRVFFNFVDPEKDQVLGLAVGRLCASTIFRQ